MVVCMKILYIWDGEYQKLPDARHENIKTCLKFYPDAQYFCISKKPSFFSRDFKIIDWDQTVSEIETYFDFGKLEGIGNSSDWMRFWFLAHNPDTLYMDTDITLKKGFDFHEVGRLMFPEKDIYILYSGNEDHGSDIIEAMEAEPIQHKSGSFTHLVYLPKRFEKSQFETIPSDVFLH